MKTGDGKDSILLDKGLENDIKRVKFRKDLKIFISRPLSARCFPARKCSPRDGEPAINHQPLNSEDEQFMRIALEEARRAGEEGEVPIGAVLVSEGKVIGRGRNRPIFLSDPTAHAEILALREGAAGMGNYRLPNSTLYVTIEPCVMCAGAILQARVWRLVFGAEDRKAGAIHSIYSLLEDERLNHRVEVVPGVLLEECREILRRFFRERR